MGPGMGWESHCWAIDGIGVVAVRWLLQRLPCIIYDKAGTKLKPTENQASRAEVLTTGYIINLKPDLYIFRAVFNVGFRLK